MYTGTVSSTNNLHGIFKDKIILSNYNEYFSYFSIAWCVYWLKQFVWKNKHKIPSASLYFDLETRKGYFAICILSFSKIVGTYTDLQAYS